MRTIVLRLQQIKIIRIFLSNNNLLGSSTLNNYNELGVLSVKLICKHFAILWVVENISILFHKKIVMKRM